MSAPPPDSEYAEQLSACFREQAPRVYAYALRRLQSPEDAEDLVAEVFLAAWCEVERLPDDPLPWLLGPARRRLANAWRILRRHHRLLLRLHAAAAAGPVPDHLDLDDSKDGPVLAALARLSNRTRPSLGASACQSGEYWIDTLTPVGCGMRAQ
jgi:DNA-directed RNA polymerase specialized sigma24 family protein